MPLLVGIGLTDLQKNLEGACPQPPDSAIPVLSLGVCYHQFQIKKCVISGRPKMWIL